MKRALLALLALCGAFALPAQAAQVVTSTTWVAALAMAAGVDRVTVIAPAGLAHPPDYDPKPSELLAVSRADFVLVGGYEAFLARLREALGAKGRLLTVTTTYDPQGVRKEIAAIGDALGTRARADAFADRYDAQWAASTQRLRARSRTKTIVVVQKFILPWAQLLGVEPVATFGPGPLSADELRRLSALRPTLIIDNAHAAPSAALAEVTGAQRAVLTNFPGSGESLLDVLNRNTQRLEAALPP